MNPLKGLLGLVVIVAIFIAAFYAYSNLSRRDSPPTQTATISDFINTNKPEGPESKKVAVTSSTTSPSRPTLNGFKENELKAGLDKIKDGLDLLTNPVE